MRCRSHFEHKGWHGPEGLFAMRGGRGWQGNWGPFHFEFGDEGPGWGHGRRGRRRMFESGELRLVLLKLIADEPRHGYDLIKAIEELTGGRYAPSPGVVYPTLTMLEEMGFIEQSGGEGARKPYQITDAGRAHIEENEEEADELVRGSRRSARHTLRRADRRSGAPCATSGKRSATASRMAKSPRRPSSSSPR